MPALHDTALTRFGRLLGTTLRRELAGPTPCPEWTVRQLVEHTIGLNRGFAAAIATSDAPASAYEPRPIGEWEESAVVAGADEGWTGLLCTLGRDPAWTASAVDPVVAGGPAD